MLYDLRNPSRATRIVYDINGKEIRVKPGESESGVELPHSLVQLLFKASHELEIAEHVAEPAQRAAGLVITGMYGIGDAIHQRALIRQLMRQEEVWLSTCHWHVYHDLVEAGLHLTFQDTRLRAQAKTIARERGLFGPVPRPPDDAHHVKLWYRKDQIDRYGSILEAMAGTMTDQGHPVDPAKLDFSLPIPAAWTAPEIDTGGKPLMIYRPIVLRREWNSANRNPDPDGYAALYQAAREGYFVVSIADLQVGEEWIIGHEAEVDLRLHGGQLDFQSMAALFKRASLVFCNAGFAPVLAQAVGTPSIVIYGGRESYRTTQRAGAHLAPTLGIDPIRPCDCHTERHDCGDKAIDLVAALDRVRPFADKYRTAPVEGRAHGGRRAEGENRARPRLLIFATTYVDSADRQTLTAQWLKLHRALNPDCDFLLVDSASPLPLTQDGPPEVEVFNFGDNIGHLSRRGRDGWGRAFCKGLELAVERGYDFAVHIEGDSLLRLKARDLVGEMAKTGKPVGSIPVRGMEREFAGWVETGLMAFDCDWVKRSRFTQRYDWPNREARPTPEVIVRGAVGEANLHLWTIKGWRGDKHQITHANIVSLDLDWVTHCHNDVWAYDRFVGAALDGGRREAVNPPASSTHVASRTTPARKLNLGCGDNKLPGWENHDSDVDITKPLPWADNSADFIFIEHCVEHVSYHQAARFFQEARRVLKQGGILRVTAPSIEQIAASHDQDYFDFTAKWGGEATRHGALNAIIFAHGHQAAWTASLLRATLDFAGFTDLRACPVGVSDHPPLAGVEGHGKVIGDRFNRIESLCFEGSKPGSSFKTDPGERARNRPERTRIAVVVGGGKDVLQEVELTRQLLGGQPAKWFVINDMIPVFPDRCAAVTLHPQSVGVWLMERRKAGLPEPDAVWAHSKGSDRHPYREVTDVADDWRGSSGLFAVSVASRTGHDKIILAGVPMDRAHGHFKRGAGPWSACETFRVAWEHRRQTLAPIVRSWSGWTEKAFGRPSLAFLEAVEAAA